MISGVHTSVTYRDEGGGVVLSIQKYDDIMYTCSWAQGLPERI